MISKVNTSIRCVLWMLAFSLSSLNTVTSFGQEAGSDAPVQNYDVPAGDAEKTLKLFTQQSGQQILYSPKIVSGVQTNAVKGTMTAEAAIFIILDKTPLTATRDEKIGAYSIQRTAASTSVEKKKRRPTDK